ncbi:MAG: hypothetical protein J6J51_00215, partial [Clostridia bacterium]|nr:hypothetical protein [Clostridia bacterium]
LVFQTKNGDTLLSYGWEDMGERWQGASDDTSLTFLYRLNPTGDAKSAMGLTMTSILGGPLDSWGTYRSGDYYIWAFSTGEEYKDWGYAVYKEYDGAFKLLDWHLYENAAFVQNDIYVCPDPAVLSDDGTMTDENTYDVILNCNMQLDRVVRTVTVDGEVHHTVEKENINGSSLILFNWDDQDAPKPHSVSQHFYDKWGEKIEVSSMTQEDLMLAVFSQDYPNTAPVDWVLADDGAQDLLGVVIFSEKPGATEFAFVKNGHCARAGLGAAVCPESDLIYEGDATVSVVLQDDKADLYRMYLAYSVNEEKRETHFDHWAELIQASPMQTFIPQTEDEERLLNFFQKSIPNTEPVDWVAVNDDTSCFLGVVLYTNESDHATLAFVWEDACTMSVIRATVLPDSQLTYEGDGTVSVVLKGTNGITQRYYRQYTRSEDGIGISYHDWTEAAE